MNTGMQDVHNLAWKLRAVRDGWANTSLLDTYETERRPVAQRNTDQSLGNAMKMLELFTELGIDDVAAADRARFDTHHVRPRRPRARAMPLSRASRTTSTCSACTSARATRRAPSCRMARRCRSPRTRCAITCRRAGRARACRTPGSSRRGATLDARPGRATGFTLLTGPRGAVWTEATAGCGPAPLTCLVAGRDFADPDGHWDRVCELEDDGALLVRPDQHVAWRARRAPADPRASLGDALGRIVTPQDDGVARQVDRALRRAEHPLHHRLEVLERQRLVRRVEAVLVVRRAELGACVRSTGGRGTARACCGRGPRWWKK